MDKNLMINDIICVNDGQPCRVIGINRRFFCYLQDGKEYLGRYEEIRPLILTNDWIKTNKVRSICKQNSISIDFSRTHKLKLSILDPEGKIEISYFYPKPKYVHELQHILRNFNEIEI